MENKDFNSDYLRGHIDTIILKSLFDGEKYGYEICKDIETKSNGSFILKQPSLYSALKRLESSGLISSRWQDSEIGGKRHYYSLTEEGKKHYEETQAEWNYSYNILHNLLSDAPKTNNEPNLPQNEILSIEKNDAEFIGSEETTENPATYSSIEISATDNDLENSNQLNFFDSNKNTNEESNQETQQQPDIEPEIMVADKNEQKNDAEFINETIIDDENDVSFSNNVYFRVKNDISRIAPQPNYNISKVSSEQNNQTQTGEKLQFVKTPPILPLDNYEIKPYSKHNIRSKKTEFIKKSKFYFVLSFLTSLIMLFEVAAIVTMFNVFNLNTGLSTGFIITFTSIAFLIFILSLITLLMNPYKKGTIRLKNQFLIKTIIFFILTLIIIGVNLVYDIHCFRSITSFTTMLIPTIFCINIIIEEGIYNLLKNNVKFKA